MSDNDSDGDDLLQSPMCSQGSHGQGRAASAYTTPLKSRLTALPRKPPAQSPLTPVWGNLTPDDPASAFFGFDDSPKPKPRCVARSRRWRGKRLISPRQSGVSH